MRFTVDRAAFAEMVTTVAKVLPSRPTIPVLGGILIQACEDSLFLTAYDYETSIVARLNADVSDDGQALVSGKLLADIAKALPRKPVQVAVDGMIVRIVCGTARFSLPMMPIEEYPAVPTAPEVSGVVPVDLFAEAVNQVSVATGKDDALPMLTGIRIESVDGRVTFAGTDRFRLAVREFTWDGPDTEMLIPSRTLVDVTRSLPAGTHEVGLGLADGLLGVDLGAVTMTARLLDMAFPKFRQLMPTEHTAVCVVDADELVGAVKRAGLVAAHGAQVRLTFDPDGVKVAALADDGGSSEEVVEADGFVGEPLTIAFNPQYLTDGLVSLSGSQVVFGFTSPTRPATLRPFDGNTPVGDGPYQAISTDYVYLLMPVRIAG